MTVMVVQQKMLMERTIGGIAKSGKLTFTSFNPSSFLLRRAISLFSGGSTTRSNVSWGSVIDRASVDGELRVFIVAGEVSGDSIASRLMAAIKRLSPLPVCFAGVGGALMNKESLHSLFAMEDISVMGIWELIPHLDKIRNRIMETTLNAYRFRPHVVVTVDSKGFSFRFLKQLKAKYNQQGDDCPIHVHYVSPSFWAWKGGEVRLKGLCSFVDHVLCILPFEEEICRENGISATFVGHPILEDAFHGNKGAEAVMNKVLMQGNGDRFHQKYGLDYGSTAITLLPGSRLQEVNRMLPIFLNSMELLKESFPRLVAIIMVAPNHHVEAYVDRTVKNASTSTILVPGASIDDKYDAFTASIAALCTSGTAVLELQLARLPCLVAYRAHFLTEWIIKWRTKLQYISLPNILLDKAVVPEALFSSCTPKNVSRLLREVVLDVNIREKQIVAADKVLRSLCPSWNSGTLLPKDSKFSLDNHSPSAIAAATILYSARKN